MDRKQQAERIQRIMDSIAQRAVRLPADTRLSFIKDEVARVRGDFQRTYKTDARLAGSAMTFEDGMYGQIKMLVKNLETEAIRQSR